MSKQQRWIEWIRKSPSWTLGTIGLISAVATFLIASRDNPYLVATVTIAICLLALFLLCIYLAFAKRIGLQRGILTELRETVASRFSDGELRTLCFDLGVDYDDLLGGGKADKARELVSYLERRNRIPELVEIGKQRRPDISWGDASEALSEGLQAVHRFKKGRRWALLGIVLIPVLSGAILLSGWGKSFVAIAVFGTPTPTATATVALTPTVMPPTDAPTSTATPTPTAVPSATPSPTPPAGDASTILIAEFYAEKASRTMEVARRLESDLQDQLWRYGLDNVNVKAVLQPLESEDDAQVLANEENAEVVIWGWYDDDGIEVRVFLASQDQVGREIPGTHELPLELGGDPGTELAFVVRNVLPDNVSFLSLFVIGHLYYLSNEYQAGHDAFDAAMENLPDPETVALANEAVVHFFRARQLQAKGSDELTEIVCAYVRAIELDPDFAEAYNNLGIILAQQGHYTALPAEARLCLEDAGGLRSPIELFEYALQQKPDWVAVKYNQLVYYWENMDLLSTKLHQELQSESEPTIDFHTEAMAWLRSGFEAVLQDDPSIFGVYPVLANMAFEEGDLEEALRWLSDALARASDDEAEKVQFNLGQYHLSAHQLGQAEMQLEAALASDITESEARLALAHLDYQRGQQESALRHLDVIPWTKEGPLPFYHYTPEAMAVILRSRIYLDMGDQDEAITLLEQLVGEEPGQPLEHYLLGLLYALKGDTALAQENWERVLARYRPPLGGNQTSAIAWYDLHDHCSILDESGVVKPDWRPDTDPCLPLDLQARVRTVYDLFQERLLYRLYYQKLHWTVYDLFPEHPIYKVFQPRRPVRPSSPGGFR